MFVSKAFRIVLILFLGQFSGLIGAISNPSGHEHSSDSESHDAGSWHHDISEGVEFVDSILHHLIAAISPFQQDPAEKAKVSDLKEAKTVPPIELEKLKNAAKSAGLSDEKANRVRRAAALLELGFNDINSLRRAYLEPDTSAEYADWMRKSLEKRCVEEEFRRSARQVPPPGTSIPIPPQVDAATVQRLRTSAKLSGLTDKEVEAFAKVIAASKLDKAQLSRLEEAILQHGPGPVDMKQFMQKLAQLRKSREAAEQDEAEYDWNNPRQGADWLFKPLKATASSTNNDREAQ